MSGSVGTAASTSTGSSTVAAAPPMSAPTTTPMDANASAEEELEETVSRLFSHPGVQAVIILNRAGDVLVERTTAALRRASSSSSSSGAPDDSSDAMAAAAGADMHASSQQQQQQHVLPKRLNQMLNSVRGLLRALPDPQHGTSGGAGDDIGFLQIRSADGGREIMVAPHQGYVLAVMKMAADA
jgi:hypothetical protein